jgi:hypothetical protein
MTGQRNKKELAFKRCSKELGVSQQNRDSAWIPGLAQGGRRGEVLILTSLSSCRQPPFLRARACNKLAVVDQLSTLRTLA